MNRFFQLAFLTAAFNFVVDARFHWRKSILGLGSFSAHSESVGEKAVFDDTDREAKHEMSFDDEHLGWSPAHNDDRNHEPFLDEIKQIWKSFVFPHTKLYNESTAQNDETGPFSNQVLAQLSNPMGIISKKQMWLEQDLTLNLKGMATIAQSPDLIKGISSSFPQFSRAVRLTKEEQEKDSIVNGVSQNRIHQLIVRSLAASLKSNLIYLHHKNIELVTEIALNQNIPKKFASKSNIIKSLFSLLHDENVPYIVLLTDDLKWLQHNHILNEMMNHEIKKVESKLFFVRIEPEEKLIAGLLPPSLSYRKVVTPPYDYEEEMMQKAMKKSMASFNNDNDNSNNNKHRDPANPVFKTRYRNGSVEITGHMGRLPDGLKGPPAHIMKKIIEQQQKALQKQQQEEEKKNNKKGENMEEEEEVYDDDNENESNNKNDAEKDKNNENNDDEDEDESNDDSDILDSISRMTNGMLPSNFMTSSGSNIPFPPSMSPQEMKDFLEGHPEIQKQVNEMMNDALKSVQEHFKSMGKEFPLKNLKNGTAVPPGVEFRVQYIGVPVSKGTSNNKNDTTQQKQQHAIVGSFSSNGTMTFRPIQLQNIRRLPTAFPHALFKRMQEIHKEQQQQNNNNKDNNNDESSSTSSSGEVMNDLFETMIIRMPIEHSLRKQWERIIDEDIAERILRTNKKTLTTYLKQFNIQVESYIFTALNDVLRRQLLSRNEMKLGVMNAVKIQAGKQLTSITNAAGNVNTDSTSSNSNNNESTATKSFMLSHASIDMAINNMIKSPIIRYGKTISRTKEELEQIATDTNEKQLIKNVISPNEIDVTYDMIGGLKETKELLKQSITYPLKYPHLYQDGLLKDAVKGVLLFGPPGTGKTMLAKAIATEGGASFLSIDCSTIENKWLGESEKNAKAIFTLARKLSPCVIFMDEADSILSSRENGVDNNRGAITSVKTTIMQEWDGLMSGNERVTVIASTNRPFELDQAVLRRLPRRIMVDLPDKESRKDILRVSLARNKIADDVDFNVLAENLAGYSGSDIREVCRIATSNIANERALLLDSLINNSSSGDNNNNIGGNKETIKESELLAPLRPVSMKDFRKAMTKLKASVNENSSELQKVYEWNEKYGEIKSKKSVSGSVSMYV